MEEQGMWKQNEKIREELTNVSTKIFGWDVEYNLTEPENTDTVDNGGFIEYKLSKIVDRVKMKVLIPDYPENSNDNICTIQITKREFPNNKEPHTGDIVFFPHINKLYYVESSPILCNDIFNVKLEKYSIKNTL